MMSRETKGRESCFSQHWFCFFWKEMIPSQENIYSLVLLHLLPSWPPLGQEFPPQRLSVYPQSIYRFPSVNWPWLWFGNFLDRKVIVYIVCMLSHFSRVRLFATLWTVARQVPLSMRFSRQEHWNRLPCLPPRGSSNPGIKPVSAASPALVGGFFTTSATWEVQAAYTWALFHYLFICKSLAVYLKKTEELFTKWAWS